jgi:hypothetical protein
MILPLWTVLCEALPEIYEAKEAIESNRKQWEELV